MMLAKAGPGIRFNEHMKGDGKTVFRQSGLTRRDRSHEITIGFAFRTR
jgi:hypothetical protein